MQNLLGVASVGIEQPEDDPFAGLPADVVAVAVPDAPAYELMVSLYTLGDERLARQHAEVKERAAEEERSIAQTVRFALRHYLKNTAPAT